MMETVITSSALILILLALRTLLGGKLSSRLRYAMWSPVALRLLVPGSLFESPVSVLNLIPELQGGAIAVATGHAHALENAADVTAIPHLLWLGGALVCGAVFAVSDLRLRRMLRRGRTKLGGHPCPLPVYLVRCLSSPCLYGVARPSVYLTLDSLSDEERTGYVLAHELSHYRQRDHIWSLVRVLCLCLYWFNPLVWAAAVASRRDSELACDEAALRVIGAENAAGYGKALLEMMVMPSNMFCRTATMAGGRREMAERMRRIVRRPQTAMSALAVTVVIGAAAVAATFGGAAERPAVQPPTSSMATPIIIEREDGSQSLGELRLSDQESTYGTLYEKGDFRFRIYWTENLHMEQRHDGSYMATHRADDNSDPVIKKLYISDAK